jgi:hypothetical protein
MVILTKLLGSSLLFWNWQVIEIGVGLIACNLPTLSFRMAHHLPRMLRFGFNACTTQTQQVTQQVVAVSRRASRQLTVRESVVEGVQLPDVIIEEDRETQVSEA